MKLNEKINFKPVMGVMAAYPVSINCEEKNEKTLVTIKLQDSNSKNSVNAKFFISSEKEKKEKDGDDFYLCMDEFGTYKWIEKNAVKEATSGKSYEGFHGKVRVAYNGELQLQNFFRALFNKKSIWLEENYPTNKEKGAQIDKFCNNVLSKEEIELFIKCKHEKIEGIDSVLNDFDTYNVLCIVAVQPAEKDGKTNYYSNVVTSGKSVSNYPFNHYSPRNNKLDETVARLFGNEGRDNKYYENAYIKEDWIVSKSFGLVEYVPTDTNDEPQNDTDDDSSSDDLPF